MNKLLLAIGFCAAALASSGALAQDPVCTEVINNWIRFANQGESWVATSNFGRCGYSCSSNDRHPLATDCYRFFISFPGIPNDVDHLQVKVSSEQILDRFYGYYSKAGDSGGWVVAEAIGPVNGSLYRYWVRKLNIDGGNYNSPYQRLLTAVFRSAWSPFEQYTYVIAP